MTSLPIGQVHASSSTALAKRTTFAVALGASLAGRDLAATKAACIRISHAIERLEGRGTAVVRGAAHRLLVALELREQLQRRLAAEILRTTAPRAEMSRRMLAQPEPHPPLVRVDDSVYELAALLRECRQLAATLTALTGPGAFAVRCTARQLVVALELYEQEQRRLRSERLRQVPGR